MRRREFITLLGGAAVALPLAAHGQEPGRVRRLGVLMPLAENDSEAQSWVRALVEGLRQLGWTEGRNIMIDYRWAPGDVEMSHRRTLAKELFDLQPDVIFASGAASAITLRQETNSIPIVFAMVSDPVDVGLIASLAHPGGNITGFALYESSMSGKWLNVLKEITPRLNRVMVLLDPVLPSSLVFFRTIEATASSLDMQVVPAFVHDAAEIERAMSIFAHEANGGLIVLPSPVTAINRAPIVALAARFGLPAVYPYRYFVAHGGLVFYGIDLVDMYRRSASYVDRVLKGEKPADLPVQVPTKYQLVINLKTAKTLGLTVPQTLLASADEVIE